MEPGSYWFRTLFLCCSYCNPRFHVAISCKRPKSRVSVRLLTSCVTSGGANQKPRNHRLRKMGLKSGIMDCSYFNFIFCLFHNNLFYCISKVPSTVMLYLARLDNRFCIAIYRTGKAGKIVDKTIAPALRLHSIDIQYGIIKRTINTYR